MLIYYEKLPHVVRSLRSPVSARLRVRKASGVIQSEFQGLRTGGPHSVNTSSRAREDKMFHPAQ